MKVEIEAHTEEQRELLQAFVEMLNEVSKDGGRKRAAGQKPSWKNDKSHEGAIFSHLTKWKKGELHDDHSGQHPLVHMAWRALAIAWQETHSDPDATTYKENVASPSRLRAHLGGGSDMAHQRLGPEGVELGTDERLALWAKAHYPINRRGRVFQFGGK